MEKDFVEFAAKRCEKALEEDTDYMSSEKSKETDQDELQCRAEILCYYRGLKDMACLIGIDYEKIISRLR